jgi:hypothetical protein
LEVIGELGDERLLLSTSGRPGVVCQALRDADRRVRFAALRAILRIDPRVRFPGASFVTEALGYFASYSGAPRALLAHPRIALSQTLAGTLVEIGIEADSALTGAGAVQLAVRNSDYEFILVSDAIERPGVGELLQQLRREPSTAKLPVAVLARADNIDRMRRLVENDPLAMVPTSL